MPHAPPQISRIEFSKALHELGVDTDETYIGTLFDSLDTDGNKMLA